MLTRLRSSLNYANVTATLALLIALGGSSYAAVTIGSKQIKNGAVTHSKLARNAVTGGNVLNGSLRAGDFAPGQLPKGAQGDPGQAGIPGVNGAPGSAHAYAMHSPAGNIGYITSQTKGFTGQPNHPTTAQTNIWCLTVDPATGIDPAKTAAMVSPEVTGTGGGPGGDPMYVFLNAKNVAIGCASNQFAVETYRGDGNGAIVPAADVGYSLIVP